MPDLVTVREPVSDFGDYVLSCWGVREDSPAAEVGRWLAGSPGSREAKHRLTPEGVAKQVPEVSIDAAVAAWRDRLGWAFGTLDCGCLHRDWAKFVAAHLLRDRKEKAPVVVSLVDGLDGDPEIREAVWSSGPRTVLVTTNDSLDIVADGCVVRGEGDLLGVTVWHRKEVEPDDYFVQGDDDPGVM